VSNLLDAPTPRFSYFKDIGKFGTRRSQAIRRHRATGPGVPSQYAYGSRPRRRRRTVGPRSPHQ